MRCKKKNDLVKAMVRRALSAAAEEHQPSNPTVIQARSDTAVVTEAHSKDSLGKNFCQM